jgi:phospholipid-binding lipoprotein MlaA
MLQGCATVANPSPKDPLESFNRGVFGFNDGLDRAVVKPVATAYKGVTPSWMRKGVGNFFNNLQDVWSAANNALQGRGQDTSDSVSRFIINSTMGLGGLLDVASDLKIDRHTANFGLTLGRWGMGPGPYVVLPLLGPSSVRQVAALPIDLKASLVNQVGDEATRYGLNALNIVDTRALYLNAGDVVDGAALDKYAFMRDSYLQRLRNKDYDGNPPEEPDDSAP